VVRPDLDVVYNIFPLVGYVLKNPVVTHAAENYRMNRAIDPICPVPRQNFIRDEERRGSRE